MPPSPPKKLARAPTCGTIIISSNVSFFFTAVARKQPDSSPRSSLLPKRLSPSSLRSATPTVSRARAQKSRCRKTRKEATARAARAGSRRPRAAATCGRKSSSARRAAALASTKAWRRGWASSPAPRWPSRRCRSGPWTPPSPRARSRAPWASRSGQTSDGSCLEARRRPRRLSSTEQDETRAQGRKREREGG